MKQFYKIKFSRPSKLVFSLLPTLVMVLLVLGSGTMKIQLPAIIIVFINFFLVLFFCFKNKYFDSTVVLCFLFLSAAITISAVVSAFQSVSFTEIILYNFSIYLFILLFLSAKTGILDYKGYMNAILFFSLTVIFLTASGILNIFGGRELQSKVLQILSGMDGQKPIAGKIFKGFYLQGTLAIIPACVFFLHQKKWKQCLICFLSLALALSRFGLLTVIFCCCLIYKKQFSKILFGVVVLFLIGYIFQIPIFISLLEMFFDKDSGMDIRTGHLKGVIEVIEENPVYFFFGQGPGSAFYSYGFNGMTTTVEISHFDFLRKYGIFTTIFFMTLILSVAVYLICRTDNLGQGLGYGIVGHFIVAISNPVLLSIPFASYFAICTAYITKFNVKTLQKCNSEKGGQK